MQDQEELGRELVARDSRDLIMSDDLMRRTYRYAEGLAASGVWKDITKAEQAFAKIVIGQSLGMNPAQAMQGIYLVEGSIMMNYSTLGNFIRSRDGYDYRAGWLKINELRGSWMTPEGYMTGVVLGEFADTSGRFWDIVVGKAEEIPGLSAATQGEVFRVPQTQVRLEQVLDLQWLDSDDPLDDREVYGAVTMALVNGEVRGVSRYTEADARKAGLIKESPKAAWNTSRRNMLLARSLSNLVKWSIPEVMNGMPVYAPGEIPEGTKTRSLTAGTTEAADEGKGIDLGPKVEELIAAATEAGHRGLSNRAAVEMSIGMRSPGAIKQWLEERAWPELNRFKDAKAAAAAAPETDVAAGDPEEEEVPGPEQAVTGPVEAPAAEAPSEPETITDAEPVEDDADDRLRDHIEAERDRPADES